MGDPKIDRHCALRDRLQGHVRTDLLARSVGGWLEVYMIKRRQPRNNGGGGRIAETILYEFDNSGSRARRSPKISPPRGYLGRRPPEYRLRMCSRRNWYTGWKRKHGVEIVRYLVNRSYTYLYTYTGMDNKPSMGGGGPAGSKDMC